MWEGFHHLKIKIVFNCLSSFHCSEKPTFPFHVFLQYFDPICKIFKNLQDQYQRLFGTHLLQQNDFQHYEIPKHVRPRDVWMFSRKTDSSFYPSVNILVYQQKLAFCILYLDSVRGIYFHLFLTGSIISSSLHDTHAHNKEGKPLFIRRITFLLSALGFLQ